MIRHSQADRPYPLSCYDDQFCLKQPLLLWIAVIYLSRALTLPVAMALGSFAGVDARAIAFFRAFWNMYALVPSLIGAVVLYALCRRVPTASTAVRWVWARGRGFLVAAAALDLLLIAAQVVEDGPGNDAIVISLIAAVGDLYFLIYVLLARRVRDAFSDFPAPPDPKSRRTG